jgi:hypothetical protein
VAQIQFEERVVAFIDVLGFKDVVENAVQIQEALAQLQTLVDLLESAIPSFDATVNQNVPNDLIPKHISISDCIILSAPINDPATPYYDGLEVIIMRCIQLTHEFLNLGYLLRGGIELGQVWHEGSNIVGPAYQNAYKLENKAVVPRIILSESATQHWRANLQGRNRMCIERDQSVMVNGLHDYYIQGNSSLGIIRNTYTQYTAAAQQALNSDIGAVEKAKWHWFLAYLSDEIQYAA